MSIESSRGVLLLALAFISFLLFQQWQTDYNTKDVKRLKESTNSYFAEDESIDSESKQVNNNNLISLSTNVLSIKIDPIGGDVVNAKLKLFKEENTKDSPLVTILTSENGRTFIAKSELVGDNGPVSNNERATYSVLSKSETDESSELILKWDSPVGVEFHKHFLIDKSSYAIKVFYSIINKSKETQSYRMLNELVRDDYVNDQNQNSFGIQAYTGAAYSTTETRYEKYSFDDIKEDTLSVTTTGGWVAFLQHYFVTAWIPHKNKENIISTKFRENSGHYVIKTKQSNVDIASGEMKQIKSILYVGPKNQKKLASLAENLDKTVDYGVLWWIGQPLFWLLTLFQSLVTNWGLSIILVTITVKAFLYPLASAQYRSFAKMRVLQPKLQQLKERYGEDRQKMSQAMMEMYKKEKVNPMGGCLPLIVQMPVFFALYWVLLESVEIRHAPFFLWINDLSSADPFFVLPLLMGVSMWMMQKLQPASPTMDPMQLKIMQMLPVMMTVFFVFFPSGLVLYWLVNNLLSISQQLYVTKKTEKELALKKSS